MKTYSSIALPVLIAVFLVFIALKTLLGRRPLVLSARWLVGLMFMACLPVFLTPWRYVVMNAWLVPEIFGVFLGLGLMWIQMKGYTVYGVSDTYFREALLASAASLGYTMEETMSGLKIKETGEVIKVFIPRWMGTADLKPAKRQSAKLVAQLAHGMNEYFKTHTGKMNYTTSYFYLATAAIMITLASWL